MIKTKANILYLYAYLKEYTLDFIRCKQLVGELKKYHNVTLRYAIIPSLEKYSEENKKQFITEEDFQNSGYDILIIENKLNITSENESEKVKSEVILNFRKNGGIVIFMCSENGQSSISTYNDFLRKAWLPIIRQPSSKSQFPSIHLVSEDYNRNFISGYENQNKIDNRSDYFYIEINEKYLQQIPTSSRPIFQNVTRIVINSPVQTADIFGYNFLLKGNPTTKLISGDLFWDGDMYPMFGHFNDHFNGVGVLITGNICLDSILETQQTDAITFMLNLVNLFYEKQQHRSQIFNSSSDNQDSPANEENQDTTSEENTGIQVNDFIPMEIVNSTRRGYIIKVTEQINSCYKYGIYDACAVMIRRLIETLIIECYESYNKASKIQKDGDFIALSHLLEAFLNENELWNVPRNAKQSLTKISKIKSITDMSAHNRYFLAKKQDIDNLKSEMHLRIAIEALVHIAKFEDRHEETK
ncbi:hypothetical protein QHH11_02720 [Aphanizomenon sp. PH219]|nr:hypothetical protein [Aphanizomenon sp. 202]MDK2458063.1 hypothetical protein [Aphanizomenon sp. PH219]